MSETDRQLDQLKQMFDSATGRMHVLVDRLDQESWGRRPPGGGWSIAECLEHLNITSRSYQESLPRAIEQLRSGGRKPPAKYRCDLFGWMLRKSLTPPVKMKFTTPPPFNPDSIEPKEQVVAEWERLQDFLKERIEDARGLDLGAARIVSPFNRRISYNLYSAFHILETHQRRHLWQAEKMNAPA